MHLLAQADAGRLPLADRSVDLVFGSPPYVDARLYLEAGKNLGIARGPVAWVEWMLDVTAECLRVSRGPVVWVAAGKTKDRNYWPVCEGLMWEWFKRGLGVAQGKRFRPGSLYRPCFWRRVGIPGSGGDQWFRADVEFVMCFKRPGALPWSDNTAMGKPPKFQPGGKFSHRTADGRRVHVSNVAGGEWGRAGETQGYVAPDMANPGTLIDTGAAGGGHLGSKLAHENEAPFPEALAEHFVRSLCPPLGTVLDPFSGSGTTADVAERLGRRAVGFDLRRSQCELGARRIEASRAAPRKTKSKSPRRVRRAAAQLPLLWSDAG